MGYSSGRGAEGILGEAVHSVGDDGWDKVQEDYETGGGSWEMSINLGFFMGQIRLLVWWSMLGGC